ncbi:MAG: adenylosuccinate lyase [Myxococcales bacterium]|nr:MAG: adenylosuccinate lyase [Myxococcales bacterium]
MSDSAPKNLVSTATASASIVSPLDERYASVMRPLAVHMSEYGLLKYRVAVELEWLIFMAQRPELTHVAPLSAEQVATLRGWIESFDETESAKIKAHEVKIQHDVKAVEYYLREKLNGAGLPEHAIQVHFCCTSEDINNLAYALMLKSALSQAWLPAAHKLVADLTQLAESAKSIAILARTHGQPASPTTLGKELAVFVYRLNRQLKQVAASEYLGKFSGAVGNFNAHVAAYPSLDWESLSKDFVESLGLTWNPLTTQIESHDYLAEVFMALSRFSNILLSLDRDVWMYISFGYFKQAAVKGEVGSSTMPHKVNPINFENSEANCGIAIALLQHLAEKLPVSRLQRDLSDSSALRNIGVAVGHSLVAIEAARRGLGRLALDPAAAQRDLESVWEVLGEAVQVVMRKHGLPDSYEQLKDLTRGRPLTKEILHQFIAGLSLPAEARDYLLALTPQSYIGIAARTVRHVQ